MCRAAQRRDKQLGTTDLWLYDLRNGTDSRFTFDPGDESFPTFSPDGQVVMFAAPDGREPNRLHHKRVTGDSPEQALMPAVQGANPHWSADNRFALFQGPGFDLFTVRIGSGAPRVRVTQTKYAEREARFSPDVRWVAYDSSEAGRREVWVQPFPPTGAR